jgi:hypothetical protein
MVNFAKGCRSEPIDRFENLVKTPLFFVSAFNRDRLYGVVGFDQALRGAFETLPDDIGVDGRVNQLVEAKLELFAVNVELPAEVLDRMLLVEVVVEILPDLFN